MKDTFYITTTLPYVNAEPHIGFALEIVAADVIARYKKALGKKVVFNTGTDEHGQKIYQKASEANVPVQEYVDTYAAKFEELKQLLGIDYTHFIRTTDSHHIKSAQEFWKRCESNGDIYKRQYKLQYCIGCEMEKQASDLEDGKCPLHPNKELETREEENYFFKFSKYQEQLLNLYEANAEFVQPAGKLKEIQAFVSGGLQDFSISRLKEKMPWGVPVPGDEEHVMYVWFDALVNYISTLGWPNQSEEFELFWPGIQVAGKDNLRQQSAMWQAMLLSAGLPHSEKILINGFISVDGQKMSKSLGNVITPIQMNEKYTTEGTRFLLMHLGPFGSDMDVTWEKFDTTYTAFLSNGIGNLCSRVAKMCEKNGASFKNATTGNSFDLQYSLHGFASEFEQALVHYDLLAALTFIFDLVTQSDQYLSETKPWTLDGEKQSEVLQTAVSNILVIAQHLEPYMPATAKKISAHFSAKNISALEPLFPRIQTAK